MSWALEEWKDGLSTKALQKIQELEGQLDKLKKDRQQRQFQLESLEDALQKQKKKVEDQKNEGATLKRENQSLMETCDNLEKMRQKISHELQVKESQVNFQEGQLNSSKKQIEKLEQELKRYKSELERNQLALLPGDVSALNSTPQKSSAPPVQSSHQSVSRYEELQEKYNKEVEERKRLEEEVKALQIKKASKTVPSNNMSHREIARHQSSSSVFSWQQEKTPTRHSANAQETPFRRGFTALHAPWEQETTPNRMPSWQDTNCSFHENPSDPHLLDQIKVQNQELRCKVNELEHRLQGQEKDIKGHMNKWQETQLHLEKTKLELAEKEKVLNKTRDELMRLTTQFDQATAKCTTLEQKLKKISEDLSCQRQNAESTRYALEQKIKDKEKEYQEELSHQQRTFQMLDQESTQIKTKLNQELQQAKSTQNILQAELDKVVAVKQQLERNSDEFKQKLCRTEQALQTSQTKENELRKNLEEMMQEKQLFSHQLDKRTREICLLEEELKKTKYCLKQNQNLAEEMKDKNATQEETLKALQEKVDQQEKSFILEKLKLAVADLEKQRDCSQDLLKKREHHIEQLNDKLSTTQKETDELLSTLELKEKECESLKKETIIFSQWKNEKESLLNQLLLEKEGLESKINHLELCLKTQQMKNHDANESFKIMETEKENLGLEIIKLQNAIEVKGIELEAQKRAYDELQEKSECSEQKYKKEIENLSLKIVQVTEEDEHLKQKLQLIANEIVEKDQRYEELCIQYERINSLVKSQNISQMTSDDHCGDLLMFEEPVMNNSVTNILEIQGSLPLERESQKIKLCSGDESLKSAALPQHEVSSFEFSVESQKQMNSDSQKHCEELVPIKGEIEENLFKAEHMHGCFVNKQFQMLSEQVESGQVEDEDLKTNKLLFEKSVKELQLMSETLNSEKKEINSVLFQNKKEIEELTQENRNLKEINAILNIEKMNLIQKNVDFSNCLIQKENSFSELSDRKMEEKLLLVKRCEEAEKELELLKEKYKSLEKKNTEMECILSNHTLTPCGDRNNELKDLEGAFAREREDYTGKLALAEEKNEKLIFEMETIQCGLRTENAAIQNSSKIEADCLRQEISDFKHEQNKIQEQYHDLLRENDRLMKLIKAKDVQMNALVLTGSSASAQISESVNQNENESDNFKMIKVEMFPINLDAKDSSLNTCNPQVVRLEEVIKHMELRLKESEKEKEFLQKELEMIRKELEIRDSKVMEGKQYDQSFETNSYEDCKREMDEKYISVLQELSTSQNDNAQLMTSLQGAASKLNELEKMCEILQIEKLKLTSELNDSKSECILATTKMAEKMEKLVNEIKTLNNENSNLPGDLNEHNDKDKFGEQHMEQKSVSLKLLESNIDAGGDYEHLKLSNKEVQMHFVELQEKFSSLEVEHRILHEQHCCMNSKLSELCSYINTLKAENSVLSMNLKNLQTDLMKQCSPGNEEFSLEEGGSLSSSCMNEIPNLTSFVESSFYKDLFEEPRETSSSNSLEETILNSQSSTSTHETSLSSSVVECMNKKIVRSDPSMNIEDLETLCETYQISLKNLEEKYQSQEIIKNKEIQELKQLIGSERKELQSLREQYLAENEQWQQKLTNVTVEMESKLAAEKKQTEYLSLQLEVSRLQLQGLDLSSRSFLIAESEDAINDDQDNSVSDNSEEHSSFTDEKIMKSDSLHICEQNSQQTLCLESQKIAENDDVRSAAACSRKVNLESEYRNPLDKTLNNSECIHELSFSNNDTTVAMDFLENQVLIQNLQMKLKETSNENLKLIRGIEESNKKVDSLLSQIKELDYKLDLQKTELTLKICKCSELEKIIQELQKEKSDLSDKLESLSFDNHQLLQRVTTFENLNSCLSPDKVIFTDTIDIEENIAMMSKDWKEQYLEIENELKKVKSEKTNIENHAISIEGDLEELQTKNLSLEKDNDNKQKMVSNLNEQLSLVIAEKNHLSGELEIVLKAKMQIEEICEKLKEKIEVLESNQRESLQHVEIMESEIRDKTQLLQSMTCHVNQLLKDKEDLQEQLQNLEKDTQKLNLTKDNLKHEIGQLTNEKEFLIRELENLKSKLNESEAENVNLSKVLESSLIEKGEIAARLNSTQEEVHQLRTGIEKLKIRIEADEKKKHYVLEKLKESERNADSFKDKIEALERELQMSEENQEAVILDAENTKSELETLKTQMEELTKGLKCSELESFALRSQNNTEIVALRAEKENILKELQEKQDQVSQLEQLAENLKFLFSLSSEENIMKEIQENKGQGFELENLIQTLNCLKSELVALKSEKEIALKELQVKENRVSELEELVQNLRYEEPGVVTSISEKGTILKNLQDSQEQTSQLEEWAKTSKCLESEVVTLRLEKENMLNELQEKQNRLSELEASNQMLKHLETELIALNLEKENLSKALVQEKQSKVVEFEERNNNLKLMETEIFALRSEKENILKELNENQSRVSELEELTQNLKCVETFASLSLEKEIVPIELQENSDHELKELARNLKSLEMEVIALREEKENMSKNQQENHLIELEKLTQTIKYLECELVALREEKESISNEVLKEKQYRVFELEKLTNSLKCLEIEVASLRSEKESILKELQKKQSEVSELEELTKTLRFVETEVVSLRSERDNVLKELQENQDQIYEFKGLIGSLKCVETEVVALRSEKENILKELKEKQDQLCQLEESLKILKCLETELALLRSEKENTLRELQENHYQVFDLRELVQILKCLDSELLSTKLEKENVLKDLQETQDRVSELENLTINLKDLETEIVSLRLEKENRLKELQEKPNQVSELEGLTTNLKVLETDVDFKSENKDVLKELQKKQDQTRELQEMTITLKCLESEIISLKSEKENTLKELQKKQSQMYELEDLTKSLRSLEPEVISLRSEKESMSKELKEKQSRICELKEITTNLKCLEIEVAALRSEKENMLKDLQEKQYQICELEETNVNLKCLETEIISLRLVKESMLKELEEKQSQISELEQLTKNLKCVESEVASLTSEKENLLKKLCELEESTKNLKCLEKEVVSLSSEKENILKELQEKQGQVSDLEDLTKSLRSLEPEIASLRSEKESMSKELEAKQSHICELEEMTQNLKCLESELASFKSEKDSMLKDLQEKQDQICELEEINVNLKCLETEIISLRLTKESMLKELEEKQSQISELEQLTKNLKCVESEVASLTSEKENLLKKLCELEESTKNLKCLEKEVASLSSEKENILKELQEKQGQVSDLEDLTKSLRSLEPEIASLRSEKESMSKELKEKQSHICELEEMTKNLKCLETEVVSLSSDKENILKELQEKQDQISELKMLNVSFESLLEKKEEEKRKLKEESNHTVELLQKQLNDVNEKIESLHQEHNICKANEQDLNCQVDCIKNEKIHLLQQLEENKKNNALLKSSMNDLIQETENNKQKLEKETEENRILQKQVEDLRKLSTMLTQMEAQQQLWEKEKLQLKNLIVELQEKIKELSKNETLYDSLEALQCSYANLEKELELTKRENSSLLEKINKMTHNEVLLKKEMNEMMQKMTVLQEEYTGEKNRFTDHVKITEAEAEKNKMQLDELILEKCELKKSLDCLQKELKEREGKSRDEISEYQCRLEDASKKYEALLKEANKKHEMEIEAYQEKLICKEQDLSLHKSEMEILKSNKEELTNSLKSTSKILEELKKTKVDNMKYVTQLKKENENARGKIQLLIKTCKQLENEKEALQKEITGFEALQENQKQNNAPGVNVEELMSEVKELKETIEEKNKETDEYLDKYCNLLVSYEKLEKTKDMLEAQVTFLSSLQGKVTSQSSPMLNSADSIHSPNYPVPEKTTSASQSKVSSKRPRSCGIKENDGESMPSTPETFTKRIKKGVTPKGITSLSKALENTDYEPEGLPEVVKKGFADIPKGKTSPYIFRRTTLATRASPRLAAQKLSPLNLQKGQSENLAETSKPTAGGSRSQKAKDDHQHQVQSLATITEPTTRSPLSENNLSKKTSADIPKESMRAKRGKHSPSKHTVPEQNKEENCRVQ